jgi:hypothetical protein
MKGMEQVRLAVEKIYQKWYIYQLISPDTESGRLAQLGERGVRESMTRAIRKLLISPKISILSATYLLSSFQS